MDDPPKFGSVPASPADDARRRLSEHQDTVLLTDLPSEQNQPPPAPPATQEPVNPAPAGHSILSPRAAAALSQRYEILAAAGHGSMGDVYKARDRETGEIVALKLLKPEIASDQAMMERFKNELLFARKITHKNVCRVYEFNRVNGIAYTSMEFVEGDSLRAVLSRFGGLPIRKATDLILQICSGLKEAHAQGIVHRDLKPENVMIDALGNVKIMDFGIARSMEAGTRLTGSMVGTPAYMAPEQVAGKSVDYRTDIYSLGLIAYEIFTGTPAFHAENAVAVALKQMRESPTAPHEIDPNVPVAIERLILKALEKEPAKRFQSIAEFETALRPKTQATVAASLADIPFNRTAPPPATSQPLHAPAKKSSFSGVAWTLFVLLLFTAAAFGAMHQAQLKKFAENLQPPAPLPAPAPPDFALTTSSTADSNATPEAASAAQPAAAPVRPDASQSDSGEPSGTSAGDAKPPAVKKVPAAGASASDADDEDSDDTDSIIDSARPNSRSDASAAKSAAAADSHPTGGADPTLGDSGSPDDPQSYIWVARFEKQERAQNASDRVKSFGFNPRIITWQGATGSFFVVLAGPYPASVIPGLVRSLKGEGFLGARKVQIPGNAKPIPNQSR